MAAQQKWYQRFWGFTAPKVVWLAKYLAKKFDDMHTSDSDPSHITVHKKLYTLLVISDFMLLIGLAIFIHDLRYWILAIAGLQFALSWREVDNQSMAGLTVFHIPFAEPKTGPTFVLFPFAQLILIPIGSPQFQFPDEPEWVFNGDDKDPLPIKTINGETREMVRPYRVVTGGPREGYKSHLNIQLTTKATGTTKFHFEQIFDFWIRITGKTYAEKIIELRRQMYDTWSDTVVEEFEARPIGLVIDEGKEIRKNLRANFEKYTNYSGVKIEETTLRSPDLGHELSGRLSEIGEANAKAEQTRIDADAAKYAAVKAGEGVAEADLAKRKAEADGAKYEADVLKIEGREVFAARTAQQIFGDKTQYVFGLPGVTELAGAAAELLKAAKSKKEDTAS